MGRVLSGRKVVAALDVVVTGIPELSHRAVVDSLSDAYLLGFPEFIGIKPRVARFERIPQMRPESPTASTNRMQACTGIPPARTRNRPLACLLPGTGQQTSSCEWSAH